MSLVLSSDLSFDSASFKLSSLLECIHLRYHGRWIDSVWKLCSYTDALKGNPINLHIF